MPWYLVPYRRVKLAVPYWGDCSELVLKRVYPSEENVTSFGLLVDNICVAEVAPVPEAAAGYLIVDSRNYVHDAVTLHYYQQEPPTSTASILVVAKREGDEPSGYVIDAAFGNRVSDITFEDHGTYAIGRFVLPARSAYYAVVKLAGGVLLDPLFFRPRVLVTANALMLLGLALGGRRVVVIA